MLFVLVLLLCWLPWAVPIYLLWQQTFPNRVNLLTMGALLPLLVVLFPLWGRWVKGEDQIWRVFGWQWTATHWRELFQGLGLGVGSIGVICALELSLGWMQWQAQPLGLLLRVTLEGLLIGVIVAAGEEMVFRGWLFSELRDDYGRAWAIAWSSVIFALAHFLRPWDEVVANATSFPGLVLLAFTLAWAKESCGGRLGLNIGIHGGMVWSWYVAIVGNVILFPPDIPLWLIGYNRNPIEGLVGFLGLAGLGIMMWHRYRSRRGRSPDLPD